MSYGDLVARMWDENVLYSTLLELTYRCNLDCVFCYNDLRRIGVPLSAEQYEQLLADLRDMQVLNLILSGGEPLAHPEFMRIGRKARELGFVVRIKSNGHALTARMAERIRDDIDPFAIELSLHGACAVTHDRQTRVPGSFQRLLANARAARELGLRLKLNSTLTRWNERELERMFAIADGLGAPLQIDPAVTPRDDGDTSPLDLAASDEGRRRLRALLAERARRGAEEHPDVTGAEPATLARRGSRKHCGAGSSTLAVDPYGNVYPCVQWRVPVGNLHETRVRELWRGSPVLERVRATAVAVKEALSGDGRAAGFCPGIALRGSVSLPAGGRGSLRIVQA